MNRRLLAAALAALLVVPACTDPSPAPGPGSPPAAKVDFQPGEEGVGDPYFPTYGNGGYDVRHYKLVVRYDPGTDELTGTATITAAATDDLSSFNLDFVGLSVDSVKVNGSDADDRRDDAELVITPADGIVKDAEFTVEIGYSGKPQAIQSPDFGEGGFLHTADGAIALGQPESASTWFPVNDHPIDKATYEVEATVPDGLSALSNGVPGGSADDGGWTTWKWSEKVPMASYLAFLVVGKFRVETGEHKGKPLFTAVQSTLAKGGSADQAMAQTARIADFLETQFGPYPFEAYGGVVVDDDRIRYALETQSRPVYGGIFFNQGPFTEVVAHELAHQWFGDSVSIAQWRDIWLNEGFASYAEWLWTEESGGLSVRESFQREYDDTDWENPTADPGRAGLFGRAVYKRGALAVHALRLEVGDSDFFRILKTWTAEKRNGNATTADFITVAERVSGESLDSFFDDWLIGTSAPSIPR
ncbi:M1 family metallopeptidase [Phytohabitans sp. ZYX-F-186]|uniref:Aminopeptidase N n=1 Tax=Phytohabitans maris TaxID=3071409 RepID=A0ABU0ZA67_9ACTN|nr:M1 family metallopeptidase [Phytohabitans sp. ZYX-F-186]MDQ7903291.1 M1 family metallopeptidase [Phytohabitans sp. ZYX-F-186]